MVWCSMMARMIVGLMMIYMLFVCCSPTAIPVERFLTLAPANALRGLDWIKLNALEEGVKDRKYLSQQRRIVLVCLMWLMMNCYSGRI
jgi:hypothetical protein